jgi:MAP/microtubule affinity-regulating kinase
MAPEIVSKKEYLGPPADVWALGVLYFALLNGRFPFKGQNDKELYQKICNNDLEYNEKVSLGARNFLSSVLRKDPESRLSAETMLEDPYLQNAEIEYESFMLAQTCGTLSNLIATIK